jgi:Electron transfer DM13
MKLNQLSFSIVSSIAFALPIAISSAQAFTPVTNGGSVYKSIPSTQIISEAPTRIAATGTFVAAEKPTTGTAQIVVENGKRYLVFDAGFNTSDQGPDLHVVLDPASQPPKSYDDTTRYLNLGKLQKFNGEQRYPIPTTVNLSQFKSVGIWCRMANATFGYAPLQVPSSATR